MTDDRYGDQLDIIQLFSRYGQIFDRKEVDCIDELVGMFTEDCVVDYDFAGCYRGRDEFRGFAEEYIPGNTSNKDWFHLFTNPWVSVTGERALGKWNFVGLYDFEDVGATWMVGFYDVEFQREDGGWLIDHLKLTFKYASPYDTGWAEVPIADEVRY